MFVLTILLSSTLIYNSVGTIDEAALTNLSMVIKIGKVFENSLQLSGIIGMPSLFWVLRDFALKMENKKGDILSAAKYL